MPDLIEKATIIAAAGNLPKRIAEYVGRVNSATVGCEHRAHNDRGRIELRTRRFYGRSRDRRLKNFAE